MSTNPRQGVGSLGGLRWALVLCLAALGAQEIAASDAPARCQAPSSAQSLADRLNWVPLNELDSTQRARVPDYCCGAYLPPAELTDGLSGEPADGEAASRLEYQRLEGNLETRYQLSGDVRITQGQRRITAQEALVDEIADTALVEGDIRIYEPGVLILGEQAQVDRDSGAGTVTDGQFLLYESRTRGGAGLIHRSDEEVLTLLDGNFTQCEPGREHWRLRGSAIQVNPGENFGTARHARLELGGVPVLYVPYLKFPVGDERQSGLLFPSLGSEDVAVPYYLNLAPNYDLTLTPRYVRDRGAMLEAEFRHLSPYFDTMVAGAWLGDGQDKVTTSESQAIEQGQLTMAEATEFRDEDRWLASIQQRGGTGQNWYSRINYTEVSDYAYFRDLDTANLDVNRATHLRQLAEAGYRGNHWDLTTRYETHQTLVRDVQEPYRKIPDLRLDGDYRWGDLQLNLDNRYTHFREPGVHDGTPRITGERSRLDYQLTWDRDWIWGFFRPAANLKHISYDLNKDALRPDAEHDPSITAPQATLDTGLFFEREGRWFGNGYLQTFEPRLFYFYSDYQSHDALFNVTPGDANVDFDTSEFTFSYAQLFRGERFSGGDRIPDANQLSVGLTTRFLDGRDGRERFSLSLGQIYHAEDRRITLDGTPHTRPRSELAGQLSAQLTDSLRLMSDVLYDDRSGHVTRGSASLRYMDDDYRIFNLGYRYNRRPSAAVDSEWVDRDESQGDLSLAWPVSDNWSFIGRYFHDFTNERELDSLAGLEYNSCCYSVRAVWRRWLDNDLINRVDHRELEHDEGIFFELQFRGLGGVGSSDISNALNEGIRNFGRREEARLGRPVD